MSRNKWNTTVRILGEGSVLAEEKIAVEGCVRRAEFIFLQISATLFCDSSRAQAFQSDTEILEPLEKAS